MTTCIISVMHFILLSLATIAKASFVCETVQASIYVQIEAYENEIYYVYDTEKSNISYHTIQNGRRRPELQLGRYRGRKYKEE